MQRRQFLETISGLSVVATLGPRSLRAVEGPWIDLIGGRAGDLAAFRQPHGFWRKTREVGPDPANDRKLAWKEDAEKGEIWVNGPTGRTNNLVTVEQFGDVEVELEFLVAKGSNSGIKLQGLYEIQIYDSFGVPAEKFDASGMGGIYPRAELLPRYHHIDKGYPARKNASLPPGQWQSMSITFHAPRFDPTGKKTENARFDRVAINGQVVHENMSLPTPTGHAYVLREVATGPLLLQGDHGPVAFRKCRARRLTTETA